MLSSSHLFTMPSTFDLYKNIHKGQRLEMFRISELAGQAEPESPEGLSGLIARMGAFRDELRNHARMEEVHIHRWSRTTRRCTASWTISWPWPR